MTRQKNNKLLSLVESFFRDHLESSCGASHHTIRAYRDTLKMFFCFIADKNKCEVASLQLDDMQVESVMAFLTHLENERGNTAASRNYRLAAIRSLFKHLVRQDIERMAQYQRVLALPSKKAKTPTATYIEPEDIRLILKQPDRRTSAGLRDHALLLFLYNTGARVSEALSIQIIDLNLLSPRQVRLQGKGGKERICLLWRDTVSALRQLPNVRKGDPLDPLFCNRFGNVLSRDGVAYIIHKYAVLAAQESPALRRRNITPHVFRHSCAVALLQAGVDITVIRDYLGHASIATTSRYIVTNLQMKRDALEKFWRKSGLSPAGSTRWKPAPDLLDFLASL